MKEELGLVKKASMRTVYTAMMIAILLGMTAGAMALVGAVVYMCDMQYATEGILSLIAPTLLYAGVMAAACIGVVFFCKSLLAKNKKDAVDDDARKSVVGAVSAAAWIVVVIAVVTAISGILQLLLTAGGFGNWKYLMFGNVFPALAGAAGAIGAVVMFSKMKAKSLTNSNAAIVTAALAGIALLMVIVAIVVKTHENAVSASSYSSQQNEAKAIKYLLQH